MRTGLEVRPTLHSQAHTGFKLQGSMRARVHGVGAAVGRPAEGRHDAAADAHAVVCAVGPAQRHWLEPQRHILAAARLRGTRAAHTTLFEQPPDMATMRLGQLLASLY